MFLDVTLLMLFRSLPTRARRALGSARGAFDLPSIITGVVVVGILAAGVLAAIFGVIPFAQDNGAKQDLAAVRTAEGVAKAKDGKYLPGDGLKTAGYLNGSPNLAVDSDEGGSCYVGVAKSGSGKLYFATATAPTPQDLTSSTDTGCLTVSRQQALVSAVGGSVSLPVSFNKVNWTGPTTAPTKSNWVSFASSADSTKLVAATWTGNSVHTSADSGRTWTQTTAPTTISWYDVASSSDGSRLAAVQNGGYIYTSPDAGATWVQRTSAGSGDWKHVATSSDGKTIIAGKSSETVGGSMLLVSNDSGVSWRNVGASLSKSNYNAVASSPDGKTLAAIGTYALVISKDSGSTWTSRSVTSRYWNSLAIAADGKKMVAGDYSRNINTSNDGGATWTVQPGAGTGNWSSVAISTDGTKLAATQSYGGYIFTSIDSGVTWTKQTALGSANWRDIAMSDDGSKLVTGMITGSIYLGAYGN